MSYDIRNKSTMTSQRMSEVERLNFLTLKAKLNQDYEDAQFQRKENERLQIEPAIPVYPTRDELMRDLTSQRQVLKLNLEDVMSEDEIKNFIGITFKNPEYAILTNQYWDELEEQLSQYKPLTSNFLYEYLNRFFYTKQRIGEKIDTMVDPDEYGDLNDVNVRSLFMTSEPFTDEEVKIAVREIANRNYDFNVDIYSPRQDDLLLKFYMKQGVIPYKEKPTIEDWRMIFDRQIRGFDERVASYLPFTAFTFKKFKEGAPIAKDAKKPEPKPAPVPQPAQPTQPPTQAPPPPPPLNEEEQLIDQALEFIREDDTLASFEEDYQQNRPLRQQFGQNPVRALRAVFRKLQNEYRNRPNGENSIEYRLLTRSRQGQGREINVDVATRAVLWEAIRRSLAAQPAEEEEAKVEGEGLKQGVRGMGYTRFGRFKINRNGLKKKS